VSPGDGRQGSLYGKRWVRAPLEVLELPLFPHLFVELSVLNVARVIPYGLPRRKVEIVYIAVLRSPQGKG